MTLLESGSARRVRQAFLVKENPELQGKFARHAVAEWRMFKERLALLPDVLPDAAPGPAAARRDAWEGLPREARSQLLARGEGASVENWPALSATDFLEYSRSGNRTHFEERYFRRRRMLNALALAECVEMRGRFVDGIVDAIFSICEESAWQLPAHNAEVRGGPRFPLPDSSTPIIDLFAAETGAQLAVIAWLLAPALDAVSPEIVRRIDRELETRIIRPYLARHFWWMGNGDEPMNNWTAWCTQNVLWTVFSRPVGQTIRRAVVEKAAHSLDSFLKDYGDDGACEEGALYYRHSGLCLFNATKTLAEVAPEAFAPLWHEPKIRNIAEFILHVHVEGRHYFNFADCPAVNEHCGAREFLFGLATGADSLADFAAADWAQSSERDLPQEINLAYRLQAAFAARYLSARKAKVPARPDKFYPSAGLMTARDGRYALAVKAGDNGDSHNHNDVGSFTLYKNGRPLLIDVGVESYSAKTFSARRYEIWTMQSAFHNLPTFEGVMQCDGRSFAATEVDVSLDDEEARISVELAGAYPPEAALRSYRRSVRLLKGKGVEVEDIHHGSRGAELSLIFADQPRLQPQAIVIEGAGRIELSGAGMPRIEEIPIDDRRLREAWPERLYRVLVPLAGSRLRLWIT